MYPTHLLPHSFRISSFKLAFIICALLLPFSVQAEKSAPVITVGSEIDFPPYAIADAEGRAGGFSVELLEAVADAMGLSVKVTAGPWPEVLAAFKAGEFDLLPLVALSAQRADIATYTKPHTVAFDSFFVRRGSHPISSLAEAKDKEIIVMSSDVAHEEVLYSGLPIRIIEIKTIPEALRLLASGKHDAVLAPKLLGMIVLHEAKLEGAIQAGKPIADYNRQFAFAVQRGNTDLRDKLEQGLAIVRTTGRYDAIYKKWFGGIDSFARSLKTIIVNNYHPYTFMNEKGVPDGFSVEIAKAVAKTMDLELEIWADKWDQSVKELETGSIDLIPMMAYSPARDKLFDFSVPYTIAYDTIFFKKEVKGIRSLNDLNGKTVIVTNNDAAHSYLLTSGLAKTMNISLSNSLPEALQQLAVGKGDAAIMPKLVGLVIAKNLNLTSIDISPEIIGDYSRPWCFAVRNGDQALLDRLNQGLNIIKNTGEYDAIYKKWFGALEDPHLHLRTAMKYGSFAGLILLAFIVWNVLLKRQVKRKTQAIQDTVAALQESERKTSEALAFNSSILKTSSIGILTYGADGQCVFANEAAAVILGADVASLQAQNYHNIAPWQKSGVYELALKALSSNDEQSLETHLTTSFGKEIWLSLNFSSIQSKGEKYLLVFAQDISLRKQSEDQLINLSQRLQLATSSAFLGVWDWNVGENFMIWNDRMFELYGITRNTFSSNILAWMNSLHPDDKETAIAECQAALKGDKDYDTVFRILQPDGAVKYLKANGLVLRDADGTAVRMLGINVDITEQKNAENTLKSNITKLEVLLGITSLPEASVKTISDHILSSITRLMESEYGFYGFVSEDESIMTIHSWSGEAMENCSMADKPSDFAICKSGVWAEAVRRREPLILNNYAAGHPAKRGLPAGHVQLTNLLVLPFFSHGRITAVAAVANRNSDYSQDDVAQLTAFLTSVQAITDSKQAEEELRKREGHFRTLVETIPDLIWLKDKDGAYLSCNPIFERFFGAKAANIVGKTDYDFVDRELADFFVENDRKAMLAGKPTINEEWITFADDGHRVLLETIKTPMYDSQGTLIGVLGIGRDITERRRAEEENTQLQVQLQQAQKMEAIGTLAGGIAHDFNNILGAILGYAELAQEDSPPGSIVRKDIDQVVKASYRAKDLVKQILAFSRQDKTDQIPLQPGIIIKEALKMLRPSLPSTIDIQQDIDLEAGLILADPSQIHQVMVNLCTNAFHAMEETGGTLTISLKKKTLSQNDLANEPQVQPGDFVQLSISDTGPGIPPEIQEKIFDPYFTTKEVGKGTGMGLAIIHGIVKSYNGLVTCHSVLGEGAVFHVYLPVIADPTIVEIETAPLDLTQLGNERILFIDDEEILAEMGQAMLERLGYRVTVRRNSIEALNTFQNQPEQFDLVITDQTMPGMTGSDLARRMLQIRPGMPIILCTGYSNLISEGKAKLLGIKGFAMKPLAKKDIAALIREVLDGEK